MRPTRLRGNRSRIPLAATLEGSVLSIFPPHRGPIGEPRFAFSEPARELLFALGDLSPQLVDALADSGFRRRTFASGLAVQLPANSVEHRVDVGSFLRVFKTGLESSLKSATHHIRGAG